MRATLLVRHILDQRGEMSYTAGSIGGTDHYGAALVGPDEGESFLGGSATEMSDGSYPRETSWEAEGAPPVATPFLAGEALAAAGEAGLSEDFHELLAELYDSEFDQALLELSDAAAEAVGRSMPSDTAYTPGAEAYVRDYLEPLHRDAHAMLEAIGETLAQHDLGALTEYELDELLAPHEPIATGTNPVFENFLGGLFKKIRGVVSGAANLAKKGLSAVAKLIPIGPILDRLKALVRPLLERVLQWALNKLPPALQPAAEALKKRLFGEAEAETEDQEAGAPGATPTVADVTELQQEFDVNAASLLFARDEGEQDSVVAEAWEASAQDEDPINDLAAARERFEAELQALPPGADPQPAIEGFLPAVMAVRPLLRLGISVIGRDRILRFLAGFIAPLIRPYIGELAPALSQAIANTGLSMMSLEAPLDPAAMNAAVLAGTVEDTVRRVAEQADEALEHPDLLEATTAAAFDEAAASHFPPALIKTHHRPVHLGRSDFHRGHHYRDHRHPGGHEGWHHPGSGMWVRLPAKHVYRKYTKVLTAHVTPTIARQVHVFGGGTLETFLRDRYGITGEVTAPVHIYEARHGATLGRIAAYETRTKGLGRARAAWKLQPLTPEIAGLLFGEPGLGRAVEPEFLASPRKISVGQRFYYLELRGHPARSAAPPPPAAPAVVAAPPPSAPATPPPPAPATPPPGTPAAPTDTEEVTSSVGRSSEVNVRVNVHRQSIRVALYLSEADAQEAAAMIRAQGASAAHKLLRERLHRGLSLALSGHPHGHLRWIEPAAGPFAALRAATAAPPVLADRVRARHFAHRVLALSASAIFTALERDPGRFIAAAERRASGVTIVAVLRHVGLGYRQPASTAPVRLPVVVVAGPTHAPGAIEVEIVPGFRSA